MSDFAWIKCWIHVGSNVFVGSKKTKKIIAETLTPYAPPSAIPPVVLSKREEKKNKRKEK